MRLRILFLSVCPLLAIACSRGERWPASVSPPGNPAAPPAAGVYGWSTKLGRYTARITSPKVTPSGAEQVHTYVHDYQKHPSLNRTHIQWLFDKVVITRRSGRWVEGGEPWECPYEPAMTLWPLPLRVGATWTERYSLCGDAEEIVEAAGVVQRTETIRIGGRRVRTFVVRQTTQVHAPGGVQSKLTSITWISPYYGLIVKDEFRHGPDTDRHEILSVVPR